MNSAKKPAAVPKLGLLPQRQALTRAMLGKKGK